MENRVPLDIETEIPLGRILPAPWNPKSHINGVYRRGLEGSIDYFGLRDRLHLWPADDRAGYWYCLDGNQRLGACQDMVLDDLVRSHFKLERDTPLARIGALREDPANVKVIARLRSRALKVPVPAQVIERLDADTPFTREHAKLFTATWNRNHAKYDEIKQADLFREVREAMAARAEYRDDKRRAILDSRLKSMMRPELPVAPPAAPAAPVQQPQAFTFSPPGSFEPTAEAPWGPPPPSPAAESRSEARPQARPQGRFVPIVFSLTEQGYDQVTASVLRSKSRVFREDRLVEALGRLEKLYDGSELEKVAESAIVEVALSIFNKRFEVADVARSA